MNMKQLRDNHPVPHLVKAFRLEKKLCVDTGFITSKTSFRYQFVVTLTSVAYITSVMSF